MSARFVSFHYRLKNRQGKELDSSYDGEPMMYLEGRDQVMAALEMGMKDLKPGEKKQIFVESGDAYGAKDESLVLTVPLTKLPHKGPLREGQQFRLDQKNIPAQIFRVTGITGTHAVLDGNHPLAGEDLFFEVEIKEMRQASAADLQANELESDDFDEPAEPKSGSHSVDN
jgi:FKBP-type peptidyl-prolyl cis-trans isomerase SlyD